MTDTTDYWKRRVEEDEAAIADLDEHPVENAEAQRVLQEGNRILLRNSLARLAEAEAAAA